MDQLFLEEFCIWIYQKLKLIFGCKGLFVCQLHFVDATLNSVWYVVQWCDKMSLYVGGGHGFVSVFCITLKHMVCWIR